MTALGWLLLALLTGWAWTPDIERPVLEARYAAAPSQFVEIDGLRLHLRDTGPREAPAVILLHGFGASLHTWDDWAETLERHRRVIRIDLPGMALTGADSGGDYSDERALRLLATMMDRLGLPRASLVGHSLGGRLAWRFAAAHPERVDRLVLVAPDGFASPGFDYGKPPEVPLLARLMTVALPRTLLRSSLEPAWADPARLSEARVTRYHELMRAPGVREAMLARMAQINLLEPAPLLSRIRAPVLLLWGEQDAMIPARHAAGYLAALPRARLVSLPGVGHLPQEEDAAGSVQAVLAFLDDALAP